MYRRTVVRRVVMHHSVTAHRVGACQNRTSVRSSTYTVCINSSSVRSSVYTVCINSMFVRISIYTVCINSSAVLRSIYNVCIDSSSVRRSIYMSVSIQLARTHPVCRWRSIKGTYYLHYVCERLYILRLDSFVLSRLRSDVTTYYNTLFTVLLMLTSPILREMSILVESSGLI